jgi:hypothetical protein
MKKQFSALTIVRTSTHYPSRLRKNSVETPEFHWSARLG